MPKIPESIIIRCVQNGYIVRVRNSDTPEHCVEQASEYVFGSPFALAAGIEQLFSKGELEKWVWSNIPATDDVPF